MTNVKMKRIYEDAAKNDGYRVLVDRLWPRGISKKKAKLDSWLKEIAPSDDLRKWFAHDKEKFNEFKKAYKKELKGEEQQKDLNKLEEMVEDGVTTLLFATKEETYNHVQVLREVIQNDFKKK